jgi:hypothetical protein
MRQPPNRECSENELENIHAADVPQAFLPVWFLSQFALLSQTNRRHQLGTKTFLAFDDARAYIYS